MTIAGHTSCF